MSWVNFGSVQYGENKYPLWVQVMGYVITASTVIWIPLFGSMEAVKNRCFRGEGQRETPPRPSLLRFALSKVFAHSRMQGFMNPLSDVIFRDG